VREEEDGAPVQGPDPAELRSGIAVHQEGQIEAPDVLGLLGAGAEDQALGGHGQDVGEFRVALEQGGEDLVAGPGVAGADLRGQGQDRQHPFGVLGGLFRGLGDEAHGAEGVLEGRLGRGAALHDGVAQGQGQQGAEGQEHQDQEQQAQVRQASGGCPGAPGRGFSRQGRILFSVLACFHSPLPGTV